MGGTFTNLLYHLIFSTKHREQLVHGQLSSELYKYIGGIVRGQGGVLLQIGGTADHVHIVAKFKPAIPVSDMLRMIKAGSSKWVNDLTTNPARFAWQDGYGAFSLSESQLPGVVKYVCDQVEHHKKKTFKDEFREFLDRHGIEYDEKYIWE